MTLSFWQIITIILLISTLLLGAWAFYLNHKITSRPKLDIFHDSITGLPNNTTFTQNLDLEIQRAHLANESFAIYNVRIDEYHNIVSSYGQTIADKVVKEFSQRLRNNFDRTTYIARLSPDHFGVIDFIHKDPPTLTIHVQKLMEKITLPYKIGEREIFITTSIGITFFPQDGDTAEVLMRNIQLAVNHTSHKRNQYAMFQQKMIDQIQLNRTIVGELHKALKNKELLLYYQPQIDLNNMTMVGCEALLRWNHPIKGLISPLLFIPAAEESDLIFPIGEWVLKEACTQAVRWQQQGYPPIKVSVNISAHQLFESDLVAIVKNTLAETGLNPQYLELELTESVLAHDLNRAIDILNNLKNLGVSLALDDFGTGYSSLSYLQKFPISLLKIDRSFVKEIDNPETKAHAQLAQSIIKLGHAMQMVVIAEGAETQAQIDYLKKHQCDLVQGFYFAKPQPASQFEAFFAQKWD